MVNEQVLELKALSLTSPVSTSYQHQKIVEAKERGEVKTGNFTIEDDEIIKDNFESLLIETGVNKAELKRELFAKRNEKLFMLKRQLVGFHLIQGLPDGQKRLPVEAYNRLATLLTSTFTKEDDGNILAWVDEHGPTGWAKLADKRSARSGPTVGSW